MATRRTRRDALRERRRKRAGSPASHAAAAMEAAELAREEQEALAVGAELADEGRRFPEDYSEEELAEHGKAMGAELRVAIGTVSAAVAAELNAAFAARRER